MKLFQSFQSFDFFNPFQSFDFFNSFHPIDSFKSFINTAYIMHKGSNCIKKYKYTIVYPAFFFTSTAFVWRGIFKNYRYVIQYIQNYKITQDMKQIVEQAKNIQPLYPNNIDVMTHSEIPNFDYIIDVRTPQEYNKGHYENAINIPYNEFTSPDVILPSFVLLSQNIAPGDTILFYCENGYRTIEVIRVLEKENIFNQNLYITRNRYTKIELITT